MLNSSLLRNRIAVTRCTSHVQCSLSDHCTLFEQFSIMLLWSVCMILGGQIIACQPQDEHIQCHTSTGEVFFSRYGRDVAFYHHSISVVISKPQFCVISLFLKRGFQKREKKLHLSQKKTSFII